MFRVPRVQKKPWNLPKAGRMTQGYVDKGQLSGDTPPEFGTWDTYVGSRTPVHLSWFITCSEYWEHLKLYIFKSCKPALLPIPEKVSLHTDTEWDSRSGTKNLQSINPAVTLTLWDVGELHRGGIQGVARRSKWAMTTTAVCRKSMASSLSCGRVRYLKKLSLGLRGPDSS